MRRLGLLLALLLPVSALAQMQVTVSVEPPKGDPSVRMPHHAVFLKGCAQSYLSYIAAVTAAAPQPEHYSLAWSLCHCKFTKLPQPGQRAWHSQFLASSQACKAEHAADPQAFVPTYAAQLSTQLRQATSP